MRKKFTLLFAALLACVGVVKAEVNSELLSKTITVGENATALTDGQWYVLHNHGRNVCVSEETTTFRMRSIPTDGTLAENVPGMLFKLTATETVGQYYLVSGNGLYFDFTQNNTSSVSTVPVAYTIATIGTNAGHFYMQKVENEFVADGQGDGEGFVCWGTNVPTSVGGNNCYHFKPVTLTAVTLHEVTYNYYVGDELKHTEVLTQADGSDVAAPTFGYVNFTAPEGKVSASNKVFDIDCTLDDAPFTFSTVENPVWLVVEMHRYGSFRVWDYVGNDTPVRVTEMSADKMGVVEDSKLWCFVGSHFGFKIYNKKSGFTVTLNSTSGNPKVGAASNGNDEWFFAKSTATEDKNACCFTSRNTSYMNRQGSGNIGYWSDADNGSTCYFEDPSAIFLPAANDFAEILASYEIPAGTPENALGIINATEKQVTDFVEGVAAEPTAVDALQALYAAANAIKATAAPVTTGYYFIKNAGVNGNNADWYLTHKKEGDKECLWAVAPSGALNADYVWKFESCEDGYKLQCVNLGKYFQLKTATNGGDNNTYISDGYDAGNKMFFASDIYGKFIIKNAANENIRTEGNGQVNYWSGESGESWYLIPVSELEMTIDEYASVCLPFDVKPSEGVEAYAVTATAATEVTLTPKEDIPAGEGAILAGNGAVKLTIATATSNWDDNLLEGTTVATEVEGAAYILSETEAKGIGLYKVKLTDGKFTNNANKAYLPASAVSNASAAMFGFGRGEGTTGIEKTELTTGNVAIYDLLGRRVEKIEKGIYIVNGKKVVVK